MKTHYSKTRVGIVVVALAMIFVFFFARLVFIQIVKGADYREIAHRQYLQSKIVPAERGTIFDAKGKKIAINDSFRSLCAYPLNSKDANASYNQIAYILNRKTLSVRKNHSLAPKKFNYIKRGLSNSEYARFNKCTNKYGLFIEEEPTRNYPYGEIGRGITGFVDLDNQGCAGIELVMNEYLSGISGRSAIQLDGLGKEYQIKEIPLKKAVAGNSVFLTVDWDKQQIVEEELAWAVDKFNAKSGMAVFLNPHTGAVIAAADYDPLDDNRDKPMKLNAVTNTFEPGSVFKLITAAAVLEKGFIDPSDSFDAEQGRWRLGRNLLRDDHKYDSLSFRSAFELSSNIVMGKVAIETGGNNIYAMAKKFGFGSKTRCGLNGESKGFLNKPGRWSKFVTSTYAIGHGLSVTPLQMAQAFAVIAADGELNRPYFVSGCINQEGKIINRHESRSIQIIDEKTVTQLKEFLRGVVVNGTGELLADANVDIAGKTGTAEKPDLINGGYHKNKYMASFAGYFPADSPLVAGIVILDEPEPIHYGGHTSGPAFKNIAEKFAAIDNYSGGEAKTQKAEFLPAPESMAVPINDLLQVPDLVKYSRKDASSKCSKAGLNICFHGQGDKVIFISPPAKALMMIGDTVNCYLNLANTSVKTVPDLTGLTVREALALTELYGYSFEFSGKGRVVSQFPDAGDNIAADEKLKLRFSRDTGV